MELTTVIYQKDVYIYTDLMIANTYCSLYNARWFQIILLRQAITVVVIVV